MLGTYAGGCHHAVQSGGQCVRCLAGADNGETDTALDTEFVLLLKGGLWQGSHRVGQL